MQRHLSFVGIAALVLSLSGCPFKKQPPPVPQQGQAPTVQPEPAPPPPAPETVETQPPPPPAETPPEKTESAAEKKPPKKKTTPKKPAAAPATAAQAQQQTQTGAAPAAAPTNTSKLIIQEGRPPNSQGELAAGVGLDDSSSHAKQTTEQLLQSAQTNLNSINRPLSPEEQAMVAQIKDYMAQSRKATADSDNVRAHNLALKAHLLSDELVKH
jgi:hypothetical protein